MSSDEVARIWGVKRMENYVCDGVVEVDRVEEQRRQKEKEMQEQE